ncbi:MAG: hypothetical protein ACE5JN_06255 [Candidatus Methylomirabilia bacterium]
MIRERSESAPALDSLAVIRLDTLSPHEEVRPATEAQVAALLRTSGEFTWPIIVARESGLILDGNHRYAVLRRLGARHVLAQLVAIGSSEVALGRWCRVFRGVSPATFHQLSERHQLVGAAREGPVPRGGTHCQYARRLFAARPADDPYQACLTSRRIEGELGEVAGVSPPVFEDEERAELVAGEAGTLVVYPPVLDKAVLLRRPGDRLFPPKSSRFSFPHRIIGVPLPLDGLSGERGPLERILDRTREGGVTFLARGLRVDRVYPEPLYQFRSYRIPAECFADAAAQREYEARLAQRLPQQATR